jgi:hypothetical protein
MTRRSSRTRRTSRRVLETRAPKRGTVIIAAVLYIVGLFGYLNWFPIAIRQDISVAALIIAGGLLLLGALLRDL